MMAAKMPSAGTSVACGANVMCVTDSLKRPIIFGMLNSVYRTFWDPMPTKVQAALAPVLGGSVALAS